MEYEDLSQISRPLIGLILAEGHFRQRFQGGLSFIGKVSILIGPIATFFSSAPALTPPRLVWRQVRLWRNSMASSR